MMKLLKSSILAALLLAGTVGIASADEITARVDKLDAKAGTVELAGMTMALPDWVDPGSIIVGDRYDVIYTKTGDQVTITQMRPAQS